MLSEGSRRCPASIRGRNTKSQGSGQARMTILWEARKLNQGQCFTGGHKEPTVYSKQGHQEFTPERGNSTTRKFSSGCSVKTRNDSRRGSHRHGLVSIHGDDRALQ